MIAVVTNKNDTHADLVCKKMTERDIEFFRINTESILNQTRITVEFDGTINKKPIAYIDNFFDSCKININEIQSVWYRKPKPVMVSKEITQKAAINFIQEETKAVINGLWFLMNDCYWISSPWEIQEASNKIYQLNLAKSIGFTIPKTIITTSPTKAKEFYYQYKKNVVAKVLTYGTFEENGHASIILTNKVSPENIKNTDFVQFCPTLFQEYVPKKTEFRVTVVGEKVFACEIHSQKSETTKIDWRNYGDQEIPYVASNLPQDIRDKCITLVKKLGLNFGAIDMIRTPSDQYIFLEINPSGQWYWLEEKTGLPISDALINLLVNHS